MHVLLLCAPRLGVPFPKLTCVASRRAYCLYLTYQVVILQNGGPSELWAVSNEPLFYNAFDGMPDHITILHTYWQLATRKANCHGTAETQNT